MLLKYLNLLLRCFAHAAQELDGIAQFGRTPAHASGGAALRRAEVCQLYGDQVQRVVGYVVATKRAPGPGRRIVMFFKGIACAQGERPQDIVRDMLTTTRAPIVCQWHWGGNALHKKRGSETHADLKPAHWRRMLAAGLDP
mmetsp:Transcript_52056/g.111428  ORF Transcript_52056/g.111428 Transcript_52056/m.111428 type:complete len:141 (+) Transcript_52056:180-602(+)